MNVRRVCLIGCQLLLLFFFLNFYSLAEWILQIYNLMSTGNMKSISFIVYSTIKMSIKYNSKILHKYTLPLTFDCDLFNTVNSRSTFNKILVSSGC